ncbi:hypothetical protein HBI70_065210 [Parastagonospora nodorum]|nr:hypothetical protein HBH48_113500 [Parastagonospora nodorum]KAH4194844.1 hypothetical protein HBH42_085630 [Parastagonospora nodorum]KAH4472126.1 hypothetical protein HBH90_043980 [Parastagonospora nodorum]KAH4832869.1 hypothetical protein HBH60_062070 [Parastagonospora nodorum]KAH4990379.1 hypothetical protein HBI76_065600 [Parastagonospora nodorum]
MDAPPASTYGRIMKTLADENAVAKKARANKAEEKITILEQKHIKAIARECMQADAIKTRHELEYQEQERRMERIAEQKDVLQERIFKLNTKLLVSRKVQAGTRAEEVEKLKNTRGEKRKANDDARGERRIKADPAMLIYD